MVSEPPPSDVGREILSVPPEMVVPPVYVFATVSVSLPAPCFVKPPPGEETSLRNGSGIVISKPLVSITAPPLFTNEFVMFEINVAEFDAAFSKPPLKLIVPLPVPLSKFRALDRVPPSRLIVPFPP